MNKKEKDNETERVGKTASSVLGLKKLLLPSLMVLLATLLIIAAVLFREEEEKRRSKTLYGYFDTVSVIYDYSGGSEEGFSARCRTVEDIFDYYHGLLDVYNNRDSENGLYEINEKAGKEPVKVPEELIAFLEFSIEAHRLTGGEVNIALGGVTLLWHQCRMEATANPEAAKIPDSEALAEAALHTDITKIVIDKENSTVFLADEKMRLDPGAIGKGYAAERAAEALVGAGADGLVLDVGGNIRAVGKKPSGEGFTTGIKDPFGNGGYTDVVEIEDSSAVTSGGYERYYYVGENRYHHIIDKDTLTSPEYFASVTVLTKDSGLADALSTALFCMSYEEGAELINDFDGVEAIWINHDGSVVRSY